MAPTKTENRTDFRDFTLSQEELLEQFSKRVPVSLPDHDATAARVTLNKMEHEDGSGSSFNIEGWATDAPKVRGYIKFEKNGKSHGFIIRSS